ncbi:MAG: hypothetical protein ACK4UN_00690 [Limisphaerales bacterium]
MSSRYRPLILAGIGLFSVWLIAMAGFFIARNSKVTAEKVREYVDATDLSKLSGASRAKAIRELADKLNKLSIEERRRARLDGFVRGWFNQMTEDEKAEFIELTMPTGFKQMITAFEQLPEEKRRKTIDDAMKRLRTQRERDRESAALRGETDSQSSTNEPALSKELQDKVTTIGLKTFYSESSAQAKAELAPLMEEIQRSMESGRAFRGR